MSESVENDPPATKEACRRGRHLAAYRQAKAVREVVDRQQWDNARASQTVACPICGAVAGDPCRPDDPRAYCYSRFIATTAISAIPPTDPDVSNPPPAAHPTHN